MVALPFGKLHLCFTEDPLLRLPGELRGLSRLLRPWWLGLAQEGGEWPFKFRQPIDS